ncbi:2-amino-4-hydroxy-6-hydroxymethyldihydropteridine diphosphokinase [Thermithiobacillus plumbiphilus]|uniref:2-amino-4-hydroxy-6-hydroxymethyldihydropteridine pyrophosphokinase n=1 Tax=Thermithiobacillus plumbiphilus TaxID=1729899 RepID=A0ABU9DA27_9PROT
MDKAKPAGLGEPCSIATAWIGLGSNLHGPASQVGRALEALAGLPGCRLIASSRLYRTAPVGGIAQPDYVNAVAGLETTLDPEALFDCLLAIEAGAGRQRQLEQRWGPRVLDLDLLFYGDRVMHGERLEIPHPRACERAFVLGPLAEVAGDWVLPGGLTARDAWLRCPDRHLVQPLKQAE